MVYFKSVFRFSVYFPPMVPGVATAVMWYFMFDPGQGGLLNTMLNSIGLPQLQWLQNPSLTIPLIIVTLTWRAFGGTTTIYISSLQGVNQELYEAATPDGADLWNRIRSITIPSISNMLQSYFYGFRYC
jgi:multiple sugar transport system permease protein